MDGNLSAALAVIALVTALAGAVYAVLRLRARRGIATATQRATYGVLHTAGLATRYGICVPWSAPPARAEIRALRAQISPHFVYNALTAIASFGRTDPERART